MMWAVLVDRGECSFSEKARHVQEAGASAMVVVDNSAGAAPWLPTVGRMSATPTDELGDEQEEELRIACWLIAHEAGAQLRSALHHIRALASASKSVLCASESTCAGERMLESACASESACTRACASESELAGESIQRHATFLAVELFATHTDETETVQVSAVLQEGVAISEAIVEQVLRSVTLQHGLHLHGLPYRMHVDGVPIALGGG
jgi:PA domain